MTSNTIRLIIIDHCAVVPRWTIGKPEMPLLVLVLTNSMVGSHVHLIVEARTVQPQGHMRSCGEWLHSGSAVDRRRCLAPVISQRGRCSATLSAKVRRVGSRSFGSRWSLNCLLTPSCDQKEFVFSRALPWQWISFNWTFYKCTAQYCFIPVVSPDERPAIGLGNYI